MASIVFEGVGKRYPDGFVAVRALDLEIDTLRERLEVRKLLDRAKGLLQSEHGLTEPEAFRWIQKTSVSSARISANRLTAISMAGTRSALVNGLTRNAIAPASLARSTRSRCENAVRMTTGAR